MTISARNGPLEAIRERRLSAAKAFLEHCAKHHGECNKLDAMLPPMPTRIVLIGDERVTLVAGADAKRDKFVALSHCWGDSQPLRTLKANIDSHHEQGIAISNLPATFVDAIRACKYLGFRYIWIDSLCIVQDDRDDWQREAGRMGAMYANAYVVIGTSSSSSSSESFLDKGSGYFRGGIFLDPDTKTSGLYYGPDLHATRNDYFPQPLARRGWTFQEQQLARRFLAFGLAEVRWDCKTEYACECRGARLLQFKTLEPGDISFDDDMLHARRTRYKTMFHNYWREKFVPHYTSRRFTFAGDRLVARAAVAERFQEGLGDCYLAGLWESELIESLFWRPAKYTTYSSSNPYGDERSDRPAPGIPSWSWASVNTTVNYSATKYIHPTFDAATLLGPGPAASASALNPLGDFEGAWIELRGKVRRSQWPFKKVSTAKAEWLHLDFEPEVADVVLPDGTAARTLARPCSASAEAAGPKGGETSTAVEGEFWLLCLVNMN